MNNTPKKIQEIHDAGIPIYMIITGGGTGAINELLRYGGGSSVFVGAEVPYALHMVNAYTHNQAGETFKCVSADTAEQMAITAYSNYGNLGVGVTCKLGYEGEREGRKHFAFIAISTEKETLTTELDNDFFTGDRFADEILLSNAIIEAIHEYVTKEN